TRRQRALPSRHPRALREGFQQLHVAEAGKLADLAVDTAGGPPALLAGHEVAREEAHLLVGLHAAPHRRPEAVDEEARHARRARAREAALGLPVATLTLQRDRLTLHVR